MLDPVELAGYRIKQKKYPVIETNGIRLAQNGIRQNQKAVEFNREFVSRMEGEMYTDSIDHLTSALETANEQYSNNFNEFLGQVSDSSKTYIKLSEREIEQRGELTEPILSDRHTLVKVNGSSRHPIYEVISRGRDALDQFIEISERDSGEVRRNLDRDLILSHGNSKDRYSLIQANLQNYNLITPKLRKVQPNIYQHDIHSEVEQLTEKLSNKMNETAKEINAMMNNEVYRADIPRPPKKKKNPRHDLSQYGYAFLPRTTGATIAGSDYFKMMMNRVRESYIGRVPESDVSSMSRTSASSYYEDRTPLYRARDESSED